VQILIAGTGQNRSRWVERAHQCGRLFVHVAVELLRMPFAQPGERPAPGRVGVDGVANDGGLVEQHVHELFGLRQDGLAKKRDRPGVRPMDV